MNAININNLRYADDTILVAESEKELQSNTDSPNSVGKLDVFEYAVFECCLSVQPLMILIAGIKGRLLTSFRQWLSSIVEARPTC